MTRSKLILAVLLVAGLCVAAVPAATRLARARKHSTPTGAIHGTVIGSNGKPVRAVVHIDGRSHRKPIHATKRSGSHGEFHLNVLPGTYTFTAESGRSRGTTHVSVSAHAVTNVVINLHGGAKPAARNKLHIGVLKHTKPPAAH